MRPARRVTGRALGRLTLGSNAREIIFLIPLTHGPTPEHGSSELPENTAVTMGYIGRQFNDEG